MRFMALLGAALVLGLLGVPSVQGAEYKWTGDGFVEVQEESFVKPSLVKQAVTIPPGYHAHTRADGSTFIHGDENFGKAAPHAGVARPWSKTGLPGQTVIVDETAFTASVEPCPGGVCPPRRSISSHYISTDTATTHYAHAESVSSGRKGILARIADNARARREVRQNRRGGGCPWGLSVI